MSNIDLCFALPSDLYTLPIQMDRRFMQDCARQILCVQVYILGVSHVSRESCQEIQELIQAVRPDVVLLELCKDRLRLLLDQVH